MIDPALLIAYALAAFVLSGALTWWLGRRYGIGVLWGTLIVGAIIGIVGWVLTRQPLYGEAAIGRSISIYFILLPGFVGLVLGAAIGVLAAPRPDSDSP